MYFGHILCMLKIISNSKWDDGLLHPFSGRGRLVHGKVVSLSNCILSITGQDHFKKIRSKRMGGGQVLTMYDKILRNEFQLVNWGSLFESNDER